GGWGGGGVGGGGGQGAAQRGRVGPGRGPLLVECLAGDLGELGGLPVAGGEPAGASRQNQQVLDEMLAARGDRQHLPGCLPQFGRGGVRVIQGHVQQGTLDR